MTARKPLTATGTIQAGRIAFDRPKLVKAALASWVGRVVVTIEPERETRRLRQNRYYHGVVVKTIADETGQDHETVHAELKALFNAETVTLTSPITGETQDHRIARTTRTLTVAQFAEYVARCELWAAEWLGLVMPPLIP